MPDVALSPASSPLAALLPGGKADSTPATNGARTHGQDPFAALLDRAGSTKGSASAKSDPTDPIVTPANAGDTSDKLAALRAGSAPAPVATQTAQAAAESAAEAQPTDPDAEIDAPKGKSEDKDEDKDQKDDDGSDKLADAIASGPTAVLALAPAIVAPVQPQVVAETQVKLDGPILPRIARSAPNHPIFKTRVPDSAAQADQTAAQAQLGADADGRASGQPQNVQVADATPAPVALPPEVTKAVTAAMQQRDAAPVPVTQAPPSAPAGQTAPISGSEQAKPAQAPESAAMVQTASAKQPDTAPAMAAADPVVAPTADAPAMPQRAPQAQVQQPAAQPVQQQAAAAPAPTQPRRRSEESTAPRRSGEARRRTDTAPIDAASAGLGQPATNIVQATISRPVTDIQGKGDTMVEHTLTIAKDGAWLDNLAKDIADAGSGGDLQFKLAPENLGALSVAISQKDDGASIRLTADNQQTRDILVDAQPKLIEAARAHGLKVSDTQVDVRQDQNHSQNQTPNQDSQRWAQQQSGHNAMSQNGQNRQSSPGHKPFVSNLGRKAKADSESSDGDSGGLYA